MKHLTRMTTIVAVLVALATVPVCAQSRNSRGGSPRGGSGRPSGSYSRPSTQRSMSSPSLGPSKGLSTVQPRRSAPSQSYSSSRSQSYSRGTQPSERGTQSYSRSTQPSARGTQSYSRGTQPSVRGTQPSRGGAPSPTQGYASGNTNRNRPAQGMGVDRNAPRGVREPGKAPSNWNGGGQPREVRMHPDKGRNVVRVLPRERPPMPFNRPARFWDGGRHYYGYRVGYLPDRYVMRTHWGVPYYFVDGIYYRRYGLTYYVCRPPFGVYFEPVIANLAAAACNFAFFFSAVNSYNTINENAATITAQNQTIAANNAVIAQQNETIALNSQRADASWSLANSLGLVQSYADASTQYFYDDGVFFIKDADGKYVTIVPPAGAIVRELPDDYDQVTINGNIYYKVDDTVFNLTVVDGSPYFEVLGQLTGDLATKYNLNG